MMRITRSGSYYEVARAIRRYFQKANSCVKAIMPKLLYRQVVWTMTIGEERLQDYSRIEEYEEVEGSNLISPAPLSKSIIGTTEWGSLQQTSRCALPALFM